MALLLAEGAEAGIDMLAPDSVGGNKRGGVYRGCELLVTSEDPLHTCPENFGAFFSGRERAKICCVQTSLLAQTPSCRFDRSEA